MNSSSAALRKKIRRRWSKLRDRLSTRFFDTRFGRDLLVRSVGSRVRAVTIDCGDHVLTVDPGDYIGRKVYRKGHFERDRTRQVLSILEHRGGGRKGHVLELGGNVGTQTIYLALDGAFDGVVTVEPDPRNFRILEKNIADNDLSGTIRAVCCAVGSEAGRLEFFLHRDNHGKNSMFRQSPNDQRIEVEVKPVPAILEDVGLKPQDIAFVWMDIEGYEPSAIRSMTALMAMGTPIYTEFTPAFYGPDACRDFIALLCKFYRKAIVFDEDNVEEIPVADLPVSGPQRDVLLLI